MNANALMEPTGAPAAWDSYGAEQQERVGFFTDTSVCIGCMRRVTSTRASIALRAV